VDAAARDHRPPPAARHASRARVAASGNETAADLQRSAGRMNLAIFGLSISSSWGNGHAALWRGLVGALLVEGHRVRFFERDVPWYAEHRDLTALPEGGSLMLYSDFTAVLPAARAALAEADAAIVTSYCADGPAVASLVLESRVGIRCFYDLDTPVTLARLSAGERVDYLPSDGLGGFDLVLSYTGGAALDALRERLGARRVAALYGSADPMLHRPAEPKPQYAADLSYLGTYAVDRQVMLERLFVALAQHSPDRRFVIGGAQYPRDFPWAPNIFFVRHLPPAEHPAFYSSSRLTLNITRAAMAAAGWCPSGRLFEAAACGTPVLSDWWDGLDSFFEPGREILIARTTEEARAALATPEAELRGIARRARERVLAEHSAARRSRELVDLLEGAMAAERV
jgi:spore maturation protein CgeB